MTDPQATLDAAERVARVAAERQIETLVIGAVALAAYGYIRATGDVDLAVNTSLDRLRELAEELEAHGDDVELRAPDADDPLGGVVDVRGDFGLVQLVNYGDRFPAVIEDALGADPPTVASGSVLRVVPLPQLVALKLYAGGLASLSDVVGLLEANPEADLDAIEALCAGYRLSGFDVVRRELGA